MKLAFGAIGISRALKIQKRESFIHKHRPADGNFLYFWFWGIKTSERGKYSAIESKKFIFELSKRLDIPIYLETSVVKNKNVYERYGFETYSLWQDEINLWLLKREAPAQT
ncbi:MAG: hypothetical protein IPO21_10965 [Bacteroidales bacterium]|nr:hypothetical protein [Bacteroidales bacterium]